MTKVLTSDILIADLIVKTTDLSVDTSAYLREKYGLTPGGKKAINKDQFEDISRRLSGAPMRIMPGGSSANTVTTLSRLLGGNQLQSQFIGVTGAGAYSHMIRGDLESAGVKLVPEHPPEGKPAPESAISFVFVDESGQRSILTYPGNAKSVLTGDIVTKDIVKENDALLVQGSLWQKLDASFANSMLRHRWDENKELYLCLPTHSKFGAEKAPLFQWLIPSANLLLCNDDELARTFSTMSPEQEERWDAAIKRGGEAGDAAEQEKETARRLAREYLFDLMKKNKVLDDRHAETSGAMSNKQVAFVTRGIAGTTVITKEGMADIPNPPFNEKDKVNTLGSGDTTFAGIIGGHLKGLSNEDCARFGMWMAREKLRVDAARIPDPNVRMEKRLRDTIDGTDPYANLITGEEDQAKEVSFARRALSKVFGIGKPPIEKSDGGYRDQAAARGDTGVTLP